MITQKEIDDLQNKMAKPNFWQDKVKAQKIVKKYNLLKKQFELEKSQPKYFSGPYDANDAILTISAGTGGVEACDWAEMLLRMYLKYAEKKDYETNILNINSGSEAGIKSATVKIMGSYAFGYLKNESGIHRLVRISPFDADKARHTSFALVEISPIIEESTELEIPEKDLRVDVFRASGHGGQSVNTTDSAVRITHISTGITASCQNERSQFQNKNEALKILKSRLTQLMHEQKTEELAKIKVQHIGAGWGAQVRSYVLQPYKLVKDHRTGFESKKPDDVLNGNLDPFIEKSLKI